MLLWSASLSCAATSFLLSSNCLRDAERVWVGEEESFCSGGQINPVLRAALVMRKESDLLALLIDFVLTMLVKFGVNKLRRAEKRSHASLGGCLTQRRRLFCVGGGYRIAVRGMLLWQIEKEMGKWSEPCAEVDTETEFGIVRTWLFVKMWSMVEVCSCLPCTATRVYLSCCTGWREKRMSVSRRAFPRSRLYLVSILLKSTFMSPPIIVGCCLYLERRGRRESRIVRWSKGRGGM